MGESVVILTVGEKVGIGDGYCKDVDTESPVTKGLDEGNVVGRIVLGACIKSLMTPATTKPPKQSLPETAAAVLLQSISKHPFSIPSIPPSITRQ